MSRRGGRVAGQLGILDPLRSVVRVEDKTRVQVPVLPLTDVPGVLCPYGCEFASLENTGIVRSAVFILLQVPGARDSACARPAGVYASKEGGQKACHWAFA